MKTRLPFGLLALSLALSFSFISCSKADLKPAKEEKEFRVIDARTLIVTHGNDNTTASDEAGSIMFTISPDDAAPSIRIWNDSYDSGDIAMEQDALTFSRSIPVGIFTIDIVSTNGNYDPVRIENVEILRDTITDLGNIQLY